MRYLRLGEVGHEVPVLEDSNGEMLDLRPVTADLDGAFWAGGGPETAARALAEGTLRPLPQAADLRRGSPVARPGAIVCIGQNYAAHAAESGAEPPTRPLLFLKHPNTVAGPNDPVPYPPGATALDWEVELAVVIGRSSHRLADRAEALAAVAGLTVADDLSERRWQIEESGGQWSKGKCGPGFAPLGPVLVSLNDVDPSALRLRSWVNGEPRQDSSTADMIFDVAAIVLDLSQYMTLDPGDVILTGTPEGVGLSGRFPYLTPGDVVEVEVEGLGRQRHTIANHG